ncbi:hypothetical protein DVA86_19505 [Streptomyces armeniacus]|uniref:Uncharacterized protein n=1 Tax=Streptomyces armeniacus TaxID=83291 RepID=A0A345XS89_9ACTN|nr:hypothetical protein [Streptomyces armeniacus]AXK34505.1 hypothetical protein DVA86_19505 [Streptomyces armeniacus]
MPVMALVFAAFVVGFEQLVQWHFGVLGVVGCVLLTVGVKAGNVPCSCLGAAVLALLFAQP